MRSSTGFGAFAAALALSAGLLAAPAAQAAVSALPAQAGAACSEPLLAPGTPSLASPVRGADVVASLGSSLPVAAARNAMSSARLTEILTTDRSARLDPCGSLFYLDEPASQPVTAEPALTPAPGSLTSSGDPFALASRPGSRRTLYLNFVGAPLTNTAWNSSYGLPSGFMLAPYDTDGVPSSFSTAEQNSIRDVWLRVAEDFASFDVNVTTAPPAASALDRTSSSDLDYGATAVITNDTTIANSCGCGGIAYVNVIGITGSSHEYYQPALVFAKNLGGGYAKYVAEATTHELGHNFGLSHDGVSGGASYYTGQGAWAPIMGVGYYKPLTQWSKGEYTNANNTEDDMAKIALNAATIADDHGNTSGTASSLPPSTWLNGIVANSSDRDWFTFSTGGGSSTITVTPQTLGGNLDVALDLLGSDGTTLIASANPAVPEPSSSNLGTTGLDASLTLSLAAGTYFVRVSGTGQGLASGTGYSSYASAGRYQVARTESAPAALAVSTSTLPAGTVGSAYSATLASTGGSGSVTWSVTSGSLPAGLSLVAGAMTGVPTAPGSSPFTVTATDATAGQTASAALSITVSSPLTITTASLPGATAGASYSATLASSGGNGSVTWRVTAGSLPSGLSLSSSGVLSGTPATAGTSSFTVSATDADSRVATKALSISVTAPATSTLAIATSATLPNAKRNSLYSTTLSATGGTGTPTWTLIGGSLPNGLKLSTSGVISGKPTKTGTWSFTIRATDGAGSTASRVFSLRVA